MTWNALSYPFESQLNTIKMGQVMENFTSIAAGDSGAPRVATAALAERCVTQAKLSTTTASGSTSSSAFTISYTLVGGTYSWWTASLAGATSSEFDTGGFGGGNSAAGTISVVNISGGSRTLHVDERYVQSSPPYDIGDGEIPLFCFLLMNQNGSIAAIQIAQDPPWAYHGPTNIAAQRWINGKPYRKYKRVGFGGELLSELLRGSDQVKISKYLRGELQIVEQEEEITQSLKNRDMSVVPHPFQNVSPGQTVILMDPFWDDKLTSALLKIQQSVHAREVRNIFMENMLVIDNNGTKMRTPPGVLPVKCKWKQNGKG